MQLENTETQTNETNDTQQETQNLNLGGELNEDSQEENGAQDKQEEGAQDKQDDKKEDKEDPKEENEFFGKPENYDYKEVKLPEGMVLQEDMLGKFNEYATKLNLSQKGANDLMQMAVELTEQTQQKTVDAIGKLQEAKIEGYRQLLNSDKEVGGANFKESIATANIAYDGFFKDEELRIVLAEGGLNVHPKFIKALKAIGSQMQSDTIHSGTAPQEKKSRAEIIYPTME